MLAAASPLEHRQVGADSRVAFPAKSDALSISGARGVGFSATATQMAPTTPNCVDADRLRRLGLRESPKPDQLGDALLHPAR
jgi:hypothetical protein